MESRRLILAIALSFLVLVGYQLLFVKKPPQTVSPAGQIAQAAAGQAAAAPQVKFTVDFAARHDLYLHAHADDEALEILFRQNPKARIIWAHTGFSTAPEQVEAYLQRYPGLWCELSYRYGITAAGGQLTPEWKRLFEKYPERFLVGSDTWVNERWDSYASIMGGYRQWLAQLSPGVAEQIAFRNAQRLFGKTAP